MTRMWTFTPGRLDFPFATGITWRRYLLRRPRPQTQSINPINKSGIWAACFVYAPGGVLSARHHFTLGRLRDEGFLVAVVCATAHPGQVPSDLERYCDALYWKGVSGYDFSAYTLVLEEVAHRVPGSDVLLLNDSVFGPLRAVRPLLSRSTWDLTGFTASHIHQNHIQSYAFYFRKFDEAKLRATRRVFPERYSYNDFRAVTRCQELFLACTASRTMTVGSLWYAADPGIFDPMLNVPCELVKDGLPFLKTSLFGKFARLGQQDRARELLQSYNCPLEE